jgi:hypothetical protein
MLNLDMYAASPPAALPSPATPRAAASGVTRRLPTKKKGEQSAAKQGGREWPRAEKPATCRQAAAGPRCAAAARCLHAQKVDVVVGVEARQLLGRGRVRLVNLQPAVQPVREDQVVRQPAGERGGGAGWPRRPAAPPRRTQAASRRHILLAAPHALEPHGLHRVARPVVVVAHIRAVVIGDAPLRRHGGGPVRGPRSPGEESRGSEH